MPAESIQFNEAELSDLAEIQRFVEEQCEFRGSSEDETSDIVLAVIEAVTNVLIHGYGGQTGYLRITLDKVGPDLRIAILDQAKPFDPRTIPTPDTTIPLAKRRPGGIGVHMMRSLVSKLDYRRTEEGYNELTLEKDCSSTTSE